MTTIAWIFARGGSRGLLRKNLRLLAGKPLLGWAIEAAQAATLVDRVIVSTEDAEIAAVARQYGAEVLDRPAELATDDAPEWLCWQHAVRAVPCDVFVSVPCTAPLRLPEDIDSCIRALSGCDAVITVTPARRNPYFNMVEVDAAGLAYVLMGSENLHRRQDAPEVFDVCTVAYAAVGAFVLSAYSLWDGDVKAVVVPPERAIDIDMELDLRIAEGLMGDRERQAREHYEGAWMDHPELWEMGKRVKWTCPTCGWEKR